MGKGSDFYKLLGLPVPKEVAEAEVVVLEELIPYMPEISVWGSTTSYDELVEVFGGVHWACSGEDHPEATHRFRVVGLYLESNDSPKQRVEVLDMDGNPMPGVPIVRVWAYPDYNAEGCPGLPDWTAEYPQTTRWTSHGVIVVTDSYGKAEFDMGRGDAFFVDQTGGGFSCVYPAHFSGEGHIVHRLGWLDGQQYPAVRVVYQMEEVGEDPGPGPEEPEEGDVRISISGIELTGTIEQLDG